MWLFWTVISRKYYFCGRKKEESIKLETMYLRSEFAWSFTRNPNYCGHFDERGLDILNWVVGLSNQGRMTPQILCFLQKMLKIKKLSRKQQEKLIVSAWQPCLQFLWYQSPKIFLRRLFIKNRHKSFSALSPPPIFAPFPSFPHTLHFHTHHDDAFLPIPLAISLRRSLCRYL